MLRSRKAALTALATVFIAALGGLALADEQPVKFGVLVENVSSGDALKLPDGTGIRAPIAPGAYAVYRDEAPIFLPGRKAGAAGLEHLAEDGNAESVVDSLTKIAGVNDGGMFVPGQSFEIEARPGERFTFASMFVQSNDLFYGPKEGSIALFDALGRPVSGDLTGEIALLDAGTEVNQIPGAGSDQAPRQSTANTGAGEQRPVGPVSDMHQYPAVAEVIRIIVIPALTQPDS